MARRGAGGMSGGWVGTVALREAFVSARADLIRLLAWTSGQRRWGLRIKGGNPTIAFRAPGLTFIVAGGYFFPRGGNSFPEAGGVYV